MKALAPGAWFNSVGPHEYHQLYHAEILAPLDPERIVAKIEELAADRTPVLCCFETPDGKSWCRRAMVAAWLSDAIGQPVPELAFEALDQHAHPLLPWL